MTEKVQAYNPPCDIYRKCSGCQLQNLPYSEQLKWKQRRVRSLLSRYGHINKIIGMASPLHYRNKMQAVYRPARDKKIVSGIYQSVTGGVAVTDSCMLTDELSNSIASYMRKLFESFKIKPYNPKTNSGYIKNVLIRTGRATGEVMVTITVANERNMFDRSFINALVKRYPQITGLTLNVNEDNKLLNGREIAVLYGNSTMSTIICGYRFVLSPNSFMQVNSLQTEILYTKAIEMAQLTGQESVIDAYCGIGTIGIIASDKCKKVVSVELNPEAIKNAETNAQENQIKNIEFFCKDAGEFMVETAQMGEKFDVVFTDPPRAGCSNKFLSALLKLKPRKIIYISCNPETLARDVRVLTSKGYRVDEFQPVDMFPFTKSIECIASLTLV